MRIYYGEETKKSLKNFPISNQVVDLRLIYALTLIKIAAAKANLVMKRIDKKTRDAIIHASKEILAGKFDSQFVTNAIQGGAGTSINMNVNEVIASRAGEIAKEKIHPLDDVNQGQSTNDDVPTALRLVVLRLIDEYSIVLKDLEKAFLRKSKEFKDVVKTGRTHLQDAVPITLGQEFHAYASFIKRDQQRLVESKKQLFKTNLGGTAVGTCINGSKKFTILANKYLADLSGYKFKPSDDLVDATQNTDSFLHIATLLKVSAVGISKICNDLRMMASGPRAGLSEIILPEVQKGSSIMPGKVNPVILEAVNQVSYQVIGNATVASLVVQNGQFELNVMFSVYIKNIIEAFDILMNSLNNLRKRAIDGLKANKERCRELFENSLCPATALNKHIGYDKTSQLVKLAVKNESSLIEEMKMLKLVPEENLKSILHVKNLVNPS